jgi:alkylation response protein AidB-like acyl-CoA dehydrogenase
MLLTLAFTEPSGDYDPDSINTSAVRQGDDYVLSGSKLFIPYAHVADSLLCVARTQGSSEIVRGLTTFIVDAKCPGVAYNQLQTMAGDHQCEVVLDNVKVNGENIVGEVHNCWSQLQKTLGMATVALCIDMIGGAQRVLEMTVEYSKNRVQFGRPIGSMQALQHHCANMAVSIEAARSLSYEAAWKISQGMPCRAEVSMAKSFTSECYTQTTQLAMLIHGGVGFMEDHDLPLYYRKAKAAEVLLGDPDNHRELIAKEFLD